jgi:uncharacterized protein YjbI with pentapeptide repeats
MKVKLTSGLIIVIFILNVVLASWNDELKADTPENNPQYISNNIPKPLSNGGINWSQIEVLSEPVVGQNFTNSTKAFPDIAVENDKIYVVWNDKNDTNGSGIDTDIFYRYFDGNIWSDIQVISELVPGQNFNTGISGDPQIAVEKGRIYVVWGDYNNTNGAGTDTDIFYRCNITGSGWEDVQVISEPLVGQNFNINGSWDPSIAVENGNIYVVWRDQNNTNGAGLDWDIFYRCNLTGSGWEDVQVVSEPVDGQDFNSANSAFSWGGEIAVDDGSIYVVWSDNNDTNDAGIDRDIFYRCNLTGSGWEDIQVISEPVLGQDTNTMISGRADIAVENGKIYVVWQDQNNTNGAGTDTDIFYRCNLTGSFWEDVQVISEPITGQNLNTAYSQHSDIVVDNDKIYIVWGDKNNTNGAGTDIDIFYRCNITSYSWETIQVISEPVPGWNFNTMRSNYPAIAAKNGKNHIVWEDNNNTNGAGTDTDIFYRWKYITLPSLFLGNPRLTPKLGNTSTEFNFTVTYYQLNNTAPTEIKIIIDSTEHSMLEVDSSDTTYLNGKKYYFKIKNLDIGTHTYEFNASDGINFTDTRLFKNLKVINLLPIIITDNNLTAIEDEYYEVIYEYDDIDIANIGQTCQWEFATNASWLSFNLITGQLYGTPGNDDVGKYWVNIAVNDTIDIVVTNFTMKVLDVNDRPMIITENVVVTNEDELYEVDYDAADIDSVIKHQIWSLETNATSWLNISSSSGILNGTPTNDEMGKYWINVTVNDSEGGYDFTNFTLTVLNVNDDPVIINEDIIKTESDILYEVDYNATDIDSPSSQFSWSLATNATWLTIEPNTGVLNGTPARLEAGWYIVNVSVSDGDGGIAWHEFILTVVKGNLPPRITTDDVLTAMVNKNYEVDYNGTDDRTPQELFLWTLSTNASWLSIEPTTGILSGTPTFNYGGNQYWVNVTVFDGKYSWDRHNFTLKVLKEPKVVIVNNIPQLMNFKLTPIEGNTDTEFTFSFTYFDYDNDAPETIQVVIDENNYDMDLKPGETAYNGRYEYKTKLSEGVHSYYFIASDGKDTNTSETFTTPKIEKPVKVEDDEAEKEGMAWELLILVIVIIIIVVLIVIFLMISRKKKEEPETIPSAEPEIAEPAEEPAMYPEYDMQELPVQEDLYYTPPEETEEEETIYKPKEDQEIGKLEE